MVSHIRYGDLHTAVGTFDGREEARRSRYGCHNCYSFPDSQEPGKRSLLFPMFKHAALRLRAACLQVSFQISTLCMCLLSR